MFKYVNRHSAISKIHNLNSVARILGRPELSLDDAVLVEDVDPQVIVDMLFKVKKNATRLMQDVKLDYTEKVTKEAIKNNYEYPKKLNELIKGNLVDVILYGSSAKGEGKDYDNLIIIKTLPNNFYNMIYDKAIKENGKEVGMIFVPEDILEKFLYVNVSNTLFRDHAKVLIGKVSFPVESERYVRFKELYHAGFGSAKLLSSGMNLAFRRPDIFFDKPGLFEYFMKLNRFTYHGLLMKDGYKIVDKDYILSRLKKDHDFPIPEFKLDVNYIQESFLKANKVSVEIALAMYDPKTSVSENEIFAKLQNRINNNLFLSNHDGKPLYVIKGHSRMKINDVVPVQIIRPNDKEYRKLLQDIKPSLRDQHKEFLIGLRK